MKWYLIIGTTIIALSTGLFFLFSNPKSDGNEIISPTPGLPVAGSNVPVENVSGSFATSTTGKAMMSLSTKSGALVVIDFIHNGETIADVVNPGSYVLAGTLGYCLANGTCPSGYVTSDFSVLYNEKMNFFDIVLLKEPLGTVRFKAEQFLVDRLGITEQQACSLNYSIGAPYWVNTIYSDKNLGFSFCPGATVLPK